MKDSTYAEAVSTATLRQMAEYDRAKAPAGSWSRTNIADLAADIMANGQQEPGVIYYGSEDRRAALVEGNHRLAAHERLGLDTMVVRVVRMRTVPQGIIVRGFDPDPYGYVPGDLRPSQIL